ncbi:MAG: DUF4339 domain-containing protein [Prosthecobacter sp.]|nr:DUF4339 domain-containing protein [Prosthecobacter sp.]
MTYHISRQGQQLGQLTEEDIRSRLQRGELSPADLCWKEGMSNWQPLGQTLPNNQPPQHPHRLHQSLRATLRQSLRECRRQSLRTALRESRHARELSGPGQPRHTRPALRSLLSGFRHHDSRMFSFNAGCRHA